MAYRTRRLAFLGLLTALAVVLRLVSVRIPLAGVESFRIGFGHFPILMAGVLYGPLAGAAVGALSDLVGYFLSPMGPYMPHFTLVYALTGFLPAVMLAALRPKRTGPPSLGQLTVVVGLTQALVAVLLTSYFLKALFGMPWAVTLLPRVIVQAILIPTYATLTHIIIRSTAGLAPVWDKPALARAPSGGER